MVASPSAPTQRFSIPERYRWVADLGGGGMAQVCLALVRGTTGVIKLAVIKRMRVELSTEGQFTAMFLDEARLAALLSHPNVVHTYEVVSEGSDHFLVMEYIAGQSFAALLRRLGRTNVPRELALHVLSEVLSGLEYAHDLCDIGGRPLGVVHRDVSPHNVMVTYEGQVKLVDFGIAKAAGASAVTETGAFKGKLAYCAPEQVTSDAIDGRADVFSVGVMLWELLAGRRINEGMSDTATMHMRVTGSEPRLSELAPDVPAELVAIVERSMARSPADRYPNAAAMKRDLDACLHMSPRERQVALAKVMTDAFVEERSNARRVIEGAARDVTDGSHAPASQSVRRAAAAPGETPSAPSVGVVDAPLRFAPTPPSTGRSRTVLLAIGAALVLGAIAVGVALSRGGPRVAAEPSVSRTPAAEAPLGTLSSSLRATASVAPSAEPPAAAATVAASASGIASMTAAPPASPRTPLAPAPAATPKPKATVRTTTSPIDESNPY